MRSALTNCMQRCSTLAFTAGKLELNGSPWGAPPLRGAAPALLGLELMRRGCGVGHLKLVGLAVTSEELRALGAAMGESLIQVGLAGRQGEAALAYLRGLSRFVDL